jgi:hypothetical protein
MKPRLYLETTIPSLLTAWPSRDVVIAAHQQVTREWWENKRTEYDLYISELVLLEAGAGDPVAARERLDVLRGLPLLDASLEVEHLTSRLLASKLIPPNAAADAGHLAISAVHGMHFLLTWNCTHINNATMEKQVRAVCAAEGFELPVVCTPEEIMGGLA